MKAHVYRIAGAFAAAALMACGAAPADFEGADNTAPVVEERACEKLTACCAALPEDQQGNCQAGSSSSEPAKCTTELGNLRSSGVCR